MLVAGTVEDVDVVPQPLAVHADDGARRRGHPATAVGARGVNLHDRAVDAQGDRHHADGRCHAQELGRGNALAPRGGVRVPPAQLDLDFRSRVRNRSHTIIRGQGIEVRVGVGLVAPKVVDVRAVEGAGDV